MKINKLSFVLISAFSLAQGGGKDLGADIRGIGCNGGSGLCTAAKTTNKSSAMKKFTVYKVSTTTMIIEIDPSNLSITEQKSFFGKEYSSITSNEELVFIQEMDFVFDLDTSLYLEMDPGYRLLKRGSYPISIVNDKIRVTLPLAEFK